MVDDEREREREREREKDKKRHEENVHYATGTYREEMNIKWRRLSWGAIFAGLVITLAVFLTLNLLGIGIGLGTIDFEERDAVSTAHGVGAGIWWFLSGLISLFVGGYVAGTLSSLPHRGDRALQGVVVWALMYLVFFWILTTAVGAIVGGAASALGKGLSAVGQGAASSPQIQSTLKQTMQQYGISPEMIQQEIAQALGPNTPQQNANQRNSMSTAIKEYFDGQRTPQDRQRLVQAITTNTGKSPQEAEQMVQNLERNVQQGQQKLQETKETAKEVGQKATDVSATASILLAVIMILGAVAAAFGGAVAGAPFWVSDEREREHRR